MYHNDGWDDLSPLIKVPIIVLVVSVFGVALLAPIAQLLN